MMRRRDEVLVGIVATVAVAIAVMGSLLLARGGLSSGYPMYSKFAWGAGLRAGNPVLLSGVSAGYVADVSFERDGHLLVTMRLQDKYQVPRGTTARIVPNGVFGDMMLALTPGPVQAENHEEGDTIPSGPPSTQIGDVLARMDSIGRDLQGLTRALNTELVEERGLQKIRLAVESGNALMVSLTQIAEAQSAELMRTQLAIRKVVSAVDSAQIDSTMRALNSASQAVAVLATDLRTTTVRLNGVLAKLESGEGSAGQLMNDPGLYRDTRALLQRLDSLTADFQRNPRKYINLSIF
jgi:phospholipid/cholesterol/gamma-HCH transport system substrate-binding protein